MDGKPTRKVSKREKDAYWRDGAVCLRSILTLEWIDRMRSALDRILERPGPLGGNINPADSHGRFSFETFIWTHDDDFRAFAMESPLGSIVSQVLSSNTVHLVFDFQISKEPHSPHRTEWHQDQGSNPVHGFNVVTTWVPLDVVTGESGAPEYLRGSHSWNRWFMPPRGKDPKTVVDDQYDATFYEPEPGEFTDGGPKVRQRKYDEKFEVQPNFIEIYDELDLISFDAKPGDIVLSHLLTVHWAPGNYTDRRRRSIGARWAGKGTSFALREGVPNVRLPWDPRLKDGEPFPPNHDLFPQVWPRKF